MARVYQVFSRQWGFAKLTLAEATGLKVENLIFGYRDRPVLHDISFEVRRGSFCALLGPNGAGKSTIFALLTCLVSAAGGRILIDGQDLRLSRRAALSRIGVVFQESTLDLDLTVRQNLTYYAALRGMAGQEADQAIEQVMERFGLAERATERARVLNGGHRRRTELARAMLCHPTLLLLDEPTSGLDPASRKSITDHVHELCVEDDLTVLWATHLVDEVQPQDELIILNEGRVLAQDRAEAVAPDKSLAKVFLEMTGYSR